MDPRIVLLLLLLTGCASSRDLFGDCLMHDRDAIYTESRQMFKIECRR